MACNPDTPRRRATRGFTVIELLAVCVILGILAGFGIPKLRSVVRQAKIAKAIGDIRAIQTDIMAFETQGSALPASLAQIGRGTLLDPWGHPYVYNPFPTTGNVRRVPPGARRDRFLVPINSTFDLYSMGEDGRSVPPLSGPGADDIIRANDGGFIGLGSRF